MIELIERMIVRLLIGSLFVSILLILYIYGCYLAVVQLTNDIQMIADFLSNALY